MRPKTPPQEIPLQDEKNAKLRSSIMEELEKKPSARASHTENLSNEEELLQLARDVAKDWKKLSAQGSRNLSAIRKTKTTTNGTAKSPQKSDAEVKREIDLKTLRRIELHFKTNKQWNTLGKLLADIRTYIQRPDISAAEKTKYIDAQLDVVKHILNELKPAEQSQNAVFALDQTLIAEGEKILRTLERLRTNLQNKSEADQNKESAIFVAINSLLHESRKIPVADYEKAREHFSKLARAYNELGKTYIAAGKIREAELFLSEGLKISEGFVMHDDAQTIQSMFVIPDQSLKATNEMIVNTIQYNTVNFRIVAEKADSYELLATVYEIDDKVGLAREYYNKALQLYSAIPHGIMDGESTKDKAITSLNIKLDKSERAEALRIHTAEMQSQPGFVKLRETQAILEIYTQKYVQRQYDVSLYELADHITQLCYMLLDPKKSYTEKSNGLKDPRIEALINICDAQLKQLQVFDHGTWFDSTKKDLRIALEKIAQQLPAYARLKEAS